MNLSDRDALRRYLDATRYASVRTYFSKNTQLATLQPIFDHLQPWAVLMYTLSAPPEGYQTQNGMDYLLSKAAQQNGLRRLELEKIEHSLTVFKNLPADKVLSALDVSLEHHAEAEANSRKLARLYRQGKFSELITWAQDEEHVLKYFPLTDRPFWKNWFYQTVLEDRTTHWMTPALAQLPKEKTVIAAGLLHLDGENGMIARLRQAGYRVTPLLQLPLSRKS